MRLVQQTCAQTRTHNHMNLQFVFSIHRLTFPSISLYISDRYKVARIDRPE
jgi:hypothetical protein